MNSEQIKLYEYIRRGNPKLVLILCRFQIVNMTEVEKMWDLTRKIYRNEYKWIPTDYDDLLLRFGIVNTNEYEEMPAIYWWSGDDTLKVKY